MTAKPLIRIVDDDSDVCDSLSCLLSLEGWEIRIYTDPQEFLAGDLLTDPGCLILDFRFPTTNGLEVQKVLIERQIRMPIIFSRRTETFRLRSRPCSAEPLTFSQNP